MNFTESKNVWPQSYSTKAIVSTLIVLLILNISFIKYFTPIPLLYLIIFTTVFFFNLFPKYLVRWHNLSDKQFYNNLFWKSVLFRFLFLGILYLLTFIYDPGSLPLEMLADDAKRYLASGTALDGNIFNGNFVRILPLQYRSTADYGFSFYLGLVNSVFFNSVLFVKILNILWGSLTVVLLAKTASLLYSPNHGRLTGIIAMLFPALMWFNAKYLKETLMIFIIVLVFYLTVKMVKKAKFNIISLAAIVAGASMLFYFRTVLAIVVCFSIVSFLILNISFKSLRKIGTFLVTIIFIAGLYSIITQLDQSEEVISQYTQLESGKANRVESKTRAINNINVKTSLAVPLVLANAVVSPYPSFLNIDNRQIGVIAHAHNEIPRILLYYFSFLGLTVLLRKDFRNSSLIIAFVVIYITILALTGASYFDRFQLPAVPFMIILMSVGILDSSKKWFSNWNLYIIVIWFATILWQLFKLQIRGI